MRRFNWIIGLAATLELAILFFVGSRYVWLTFAIAHLVVTTAIVINGKKVTWLMGQKYYEERKHLADRNSIICFVVYWIISNAVLLWLVVHFWEPSLRLIDVIEG